MIEWKTWDESVIRERHGDVYAYRKLYNGEHIELFPRAQQLVIENEAYDPIHFIQSGDKLPPNVKTPYIQANISKVIVDTPAMFVGRSIGEVKAPTKATAQQNETSGAADGMIEGPDGDMLNDEIVNLQQEILDQISKNSRIKFKHFQNIAQHEMDGGIVGVPFNDDRGIRLDFKKRDVYFEHDDEMGVDLVYHKKVENDEYIHVYRERVEVSIKEKKRDYTLKTYNFVYKLNGNQMELMEDDFAKDFLGTDTLTNEFKGRSRPFVVYWPNEPTFDSPYGNSTIKGQFSKQDEINWTLTKGSAIFTKNGEPKIAISAEAFLAAQEKTYEMFGEGKGIDHRMLNIITYDENGKAMELIQLDVSKVGNMQWVKDLMKQMLMETRTSEKAIDFYMEGGNSAQSGEAKWYDLLLSMIKCEQKQDEYIHFLQELYENALWLAAQDDPNIVIARPTIETREMIPVSRKELVDETLKGYNDGGYSLETTVRRLNPTASEDFIQAEINRLTAEESAYPIYDTEGDGEDENI